MRLLSSVAAGLFAAATLGQWNQQAFPAGQINRSVHFANASTGYVGGYGSVHKTTDGGATWQATSLGSDPQLFTIDLMGIHTLDANNAVAAGTNNADGNEAIVRTTDGGASWSLVHDAATGNELHDLWFASASIGYAVGDGGRILKSVNGGAAWTAQSSGTGQSLNGVYFTSPTTGMAVGNGVVLTTTNGGSTWTVTAIAWTLNDVRSPDGNTWVASGTDGTVLVSTDFGANWTDRSLPVQPYCYRITGSTAQRLFVAAEGGRIYATQDQGLLWEQVILPAGSLDVNDIQADATLGDTGYAVTEGGRVFKSSDLSSAAWPIPAFTSDPLNVCSGIPVTFQNLSSPSYSSTWKVNGSVVSTSFNYSTTFPSAGNYTVRLIVSNGALADSLTQTIAVQQGETATPFTVLTFPPTQCAGYPVTFQINSSLTGTSYQVYANDQPYSNVINGLSFNTIQFTGQVVQPGVTYTIRSRRLTACGYVEYTAPVTVNVLAIADPNVTVNISPAVLCDPGPVTITIPQSQAGINYRINSQNYAGNGGALTITFPYVSATTTYTIIGRNSLNCDVTLATAPTVTYAPMIANFTLSTTTPFVGETVTVTDNSAASSWTWTLGTNATPASSTAPAPSFSYSSTGPDTVTVHLENSAGCTRDVVIGMHVYLQAPVDGGQACRVNLMGEQGWALTDPYYHVIGHHISGDGATYLCGYYSNDLFPTKYNYFLRKLDADGNVLWTQKADPLDYLNYNYRASFANAITSDGDGNIYLTGTYSSNYFRFGTLVYQHGQVNTNPFIVKMDPDGNAQWAILCLTPGTDNMGGTDLLRLDDGSLWGIVKTAGSGIIQDATGTQTYFSELHRDKLLRFNEAGQILQINGFGPLVPVGTYGAGLFNPNPSSWTGGIIATVVPRMKAMPDGRIAVVGDIRGAQNLEFGPLNVALNDAATETGGYAAVFDPASGWSSAFRTFATAQPLQPNTGRTNLRVFPAFAVDNDGNIAVASNWEARPPGSGGTSYRYVLGNGELQVGDSGSVLMKWSPDGQLLWRQRNQHLTARDLEWDGQRFVLLAEYRTFLGLESGQAPSLGLNAAGDQDAGLAFYNMDGNVLSALPLASAGIDKGYDMVVHPCGGLQLPGVAGAALEVSGLQLHGSNYELYVMRYASAAECAVADCPTIVTSVAETHQAAARLWPNPANTNLSIVVPGHTGRMILRLIDAEGRIAKEHTFASDSGLTMDISCLPNGLYSVQTLDQQGLRMVGVVSVVH
ncbi:MAG: hypothetical protein H6591_03735 [Flavobacteriales bacterium]|nr:hypothetical protein [Flavobacteriales bacterium]